MMANPTKLSDWLPILQHPEVGERICEACRVSRGLVVFVVDGKTERFRYSCVPEKLIALGECPCKSGAWSHWDETIGRGVERIEELEARVMRAEQALIDFTEASQIFATAWMDARDVLKAAEAARESAGGEGE